MDRLSTSSFALAICLSLLAGGALAADIGDGGYKDGGEPVPDWTVEGITVGGILIVQPEYEVPKSIRPSVSLIFSPILEAVQAFSAALRQTAWTISASG